MTKTKRLIDPLAAFGLWGGQGLQCAAPVKNPPPAGAYVSAWVS